MGIKEFIKDGVSELAIARPDDQKGQIVYKHPDNTIPAQARLTVGSDEVALFYRDGQYVGRFGAGRHVLDSDTIPFLGQLVDRLTDGNVFRAELFFVSLVEMTGIKFGGRIGKLRDPESGLATELMVHGTFSLRIAEPDRLIGGLVSMGRFEEEGFYGWFKEQVLKTIRDDLAELCVRQKWPLLDVTSGAYTEEVEQTVLEGVRDHCGDYGIRVERLGNFHVGINKQDEKRLEEFYEKAAYIRMAGGLEGYDRMAAADMKRGAAEGLAKGGGGGGSGLLDGAGLGVGLAFGQQFAQGGAPAQAPGVNLPGDAAPPTQTAPNSVQCTACNATVPDGKFCSECGTPIAKPKFCSECGTQVAGKFCSNCGTPSAG